MDICEAGTTETQALPLGSAALLLAWPLANNITRSRPTDTNPATTSGVTNNSTRTTRRISFCFATWAAAAMSGATTVNPASGWGWVQVRCWRTGRLTYRGNIRDLPGSGGSPRQRHQNAATVGGHPDLSGSDRRRQQECLTRHACGRHAGRVRLSKSGCQSGGDERLYPAFPLLLRSARGAPSLGEC